MQHLFANVIVNITHEKLDKTFQYYIPERLRDKIQVGMAVHVPFGRSSRIIQGYVTGLTEQPEYELSKIKEIQDICEEGIGIESKLIALADWIRSYYGSTMIQALKTVIPVKRKIKTKEKKTILLNLNQKEAQAKLEYYRQKHHTARARLLEVLLEEKEMPADLVTGKLGVSMAVVRALEAQEVITLKSEKIYRNPVHVENAAGKAFALNSGQKKIIDSIIGEWSDPLKTTYLIHGITGSGKTEVYMELIEHAIARQEQAIVLIPEIALTYQTVLRFYRRFGERISIIHSRLSAGERFDQFERAREGLIDVMIGPRSALFTPFKKLGVIIIDEEHEDSYKSESVPRYHAREVAIQRARMEGGKVILGSATPSLEAYYRAGKGEYTLHTLEKRVKESMLPKVLIADLRQELKEGNRSILSRRLKELIESRLQSGQQTMLFLNRRGYSGFLSCRSCGHVMQCPHCDVSLSLHNNGKLVCHYCGYEEILSKKCSSCGSEYIRGFRIGTQQVAEMVLKEFPGVRILRMDADTTKKKDSHAKILETFANKEADILIGTQMIVKGHDFGNVTLVGILEADLSLHASDYRASERTFQLLTQAAGRAGRGEQPGEVVIQTYDPDHYSIVSAAKQNYTEFYEQEILYRQLAGYPPVAAMMVIHGSGMDESYLATAMDYIKQLLEMLAKKNHIRIIGPADEAVAKINDYYKKVIYIKHNNTEILTTIKGMVEQYIEMNEGYRQITVQFDMY